jgi:hypothetical protein
MKDSIQSDAERAADVGAINDLVKRVEDAIQAAVEAQPLFGATIGRQAGKLVIMGEAEIDVRALARAAIEAMREPTSQMIESGAYNHVVERNLPGHPNPELSAAAQCHRAMIDIALGTAER